MAYLEIDGKQYEAKTNFKFQRVANEKYKAKAQGEDVGGLQTIYINLLDYNNDYLLAFWDCALSHYQKDKPSLGKIEEALEKRIDEDGDTDALFKEAFNALDNSGFFKKQVQAFWKNLNMAEKIGKTEAERKANSSAAKLLKEKYNELTA